MSSFGYNHSRNGWVPAEILPRLDNYPAQYLDASQEHIWSERSVGAALHLSQRRMCDEQDHSSVLLPNTRYVSFSLQNFVLNIFLKRKIKVTSSPADEGSGTWITYHTVHVNMGYQATGRLNPQTLSEKLSFTWIPWSYSWLEYPVTPQTQLLCCGVT